MEKRTSVINYFNYTWLKECILLSGLFFIGCVFSLPDLLPATLTRLAIYQIGALFFVFAVYALNSYCGYLADLQNQRFKNLGTVSQRSFLYVYVLVTATFSAIFAWLDWKILVAAWLSMAMWVAYYFPKYGLKYRPITGTFVHLASQVVHFQMGYLLFAAIDAFSLLISVYFAVMWVGAYLIHEVMDYETDKKTGVRTSAVFFGKDRVDVVSFFVFLAANLYLLALFAVGVVPAKVALPFLAAFLAQAVTKAYFDQLKGGTNAHPKQYRNLYRLYYVCGSLVFATLRASELF